MNKTNNIIGLIGGMGPYASSHFYELLLRKSNSIYKAENNDDYPEVVIDSVPVPDFISDTNKLDVAKEMLVTRVRKLDKFGCTTLAMVCNTGHIIYPDLAKESKHNFISMIDLVAKEAKRKKLKRVGILATKTTIRIGIYKNALAQLNIEAIDPTIEMQENHERIIRSIVAGEVAKADKEKLYLMTKEFIDSNKLDGIILGCTELPLIFPKERFNNVLDCLDILADGLLNRYYKIRK
jgi:aspartate racemase